MGPGTWAWKICQYHWPVLTTMTFAVYLSMPGYTCEYMCIPFSYCYNLRWINYHNINLVVSMSERLLITPSTHSPPQMVHEALEHQLGCEGQAQPISLPSHTQAEILQVRCGGDRQSGNTKEYCSHLLPL